MKKGKSFVLSALCLITGIGLASCNVSPSSSSSTNTSSSTSSSQTSSSLDSDDYISVTITGTSSLMAGETTTLTVYVMNATDDSVTWTSSDESIATVDEEGVVTGVSAGSVTITATSVQDPTKSASIVLSILTRDLFDINADGQYVGEAESMDLSNVTLRSDYANAGKSAIETPTGDAAAETSGGKSIAGIVSPSVLHMYFTTEAPVSLSISGVFSHYEENFDLDENVQFSIDGQSLGDTNAVFGGHSYDDDWWNWQTIAIGNFNITSAGEHSLDISVLNSLPNTDCFIFDATNYDGTDIENTVSVSLDGPSTVEVGSQITITPTVTNATDTSVTWASSDETVAAVDDGVVTGVKAGEAKITATSVQDPTKSASINVAVTNKYMADIEEPGSYTVEAEDLDLSNATLRQDLADAGKGFIEAPTGDAASTTSGGESIRGVVNPSTLDINFYSSASYSLEFDGIFSFYDANYSLDANVEFFLDGTQLPATNAVFGGHDTPTDYWHWETITIWTGDITEGAHTLELNVTDALPNTDCFILTASAE